MAIPTFVWTQIWTTGGTLARDEEEGQSWILTSFSLRTQAHSYRLCFPKISQKEETFHSPLERVKTQKLSYRNSWLHIIVTVMSAKFSQKCHCLKPATQPMGQASVAAGWGRAQLPHVTWAPAAAEQGTRASSHALEIPSWLRWEFSVADLMLGPECSQDLVPSPKCKTAYWLRKVGWGLFHLITKCHASELASNNQHSPTHFTCRGKQLSECCKVLSPSALLASSQW